MTAFGVEGIRERMERVRDLAPADNTTDKR